MALLHALITLVLLGAAASLHALFSPAKEIDEVRAGNPAAALALGGVLVALAIPLAASLAASATPAELLLWGAGVIIVALLAFRGVELILAGLPQRVRAGEMSAAVLLAAAKLAVGLVLAAALAR